MLWIFWTLMILYAVCLGLIASKWVVFEEENDFSLKPSVSVLVPFRDEADNLHNMVRVLQKQAYPNFEVVFINDHSTDNSQEVLEKALSAVKFDYKLLTSEGEGKKSAIASGVNQAKGEIVLTTDADCTFGEFWISTMAAAFVSEEVQMVSGPVRLTGTSVFERWQQMESMVLVATGAAMIRFGFPGMANGANLAYRKSAFEAVNGFESIDQTPSGDDELLMMKMNEAYPNGITYCNAKEAIVGTRALSGWREFKNQRLRWASKWKVGSRLSIRLVALFVFVFHLAYLLMPFAWLADFISTDTLVSLITARVTLELGLVYYLGSFFKIPLAVRAFALHHIFYPLYAIYFGLAANFGTYTWKGRVFKA